MKKIIFLIPYFGKWPQWIDLYLETCKWNPTIDWLFFTDCPEPANKCANVKYIHMTLAEFARFASFGLGVDIVLKNGYKVCDLKPALGHIFSEHINGYDYFGVGDIDVFYGNIRSFLTDKLLSCEVLSFHQKCASPHFMLFKNSQAARQLCLRINKDEWKEAMSYKGPTGLDAGPFYDIVKAAVDENNFYRIEAFSTPGLYGGMRWHDGTWVYPLEWYWKEGRLTNNKDGDREFLYFHFMVWKGGINGKWLFGGGQWEKLKKIVHFDYAQAPGGWRINKRGIYKIEGSARQQDEAGRISMYLESARDRVSCLLHRSALCAYQKAVSLLCKGKRQ